MVISKNNEDLARVLEELKRIAGKPESKVFGSGLYWKLHALAKIHYLPARDFFIENLDSLKWDWRKASVTLLGFHYQLDRKTLDKIRSLLLIDPESGVRIAAAYTLGNQSQLPDKSLYQALIHDKNPLVRESTYFALLKLSGLSRDKRSREEKDVHTGKVSPNVENLKKVLEKEKLFDSLLLIEEMEK